MILERKSGLLMDMPDDKRPGYYAQIVKALAAKSPLFDRDKELLIFNDPNERELAYPIMEQYKIAYEDMDLWLLPDSVKTRSGFTDYGFTSKSGNSYVYADTVYVFTLHEAGASAAPAQALMQLEEHLLASASLGGDVYYVTDIQHDELMHRIAKAYSCEARAAALLP